MMLGFRKTTRSLGRHISGYEGPRAEEKPMRVFNVYMDIWWIFWIIPIWYRKYSHENRLNDLIKVCTLGGFMRVEH